MTGQDFIGPKYKKKKLSLNTDIVLCHTDYGLFVCFFPFLYLKVNLNTGLCINSSAVALTKVQLSILWPAHLYFHF